MKKVIALLLAAIMAISLAACSSGATAGADSSAAKTEDSAKEESSEKVFVYLARDTANAYEKAQSSGFVEAIEDLGYKAIIRNAESPAAEDQIAIVEDLIAQGVDGFAICCNDADALEPAMQEAMAAGIITVSVDGPASPDSVYAHIAQCTAESIGQGMADQLYKLLDGEGKYGVVSATSTSPEQNQWLGMMDEVMAADSKYSKLEKVATVYGDDESEKSYTESEGLLKSYPDIEIITCPTTVASMATAKAVSDQNLQDKVHVTGLGLPSEMAEYVKNGICPEFMLWSPVDCGYLAGCTLVAIANGQVKGELGEKFDAGRLGTGFEFVELEDRVQVVLGPPRIFDASNIDEWKDVF